MHMYWYHTGIPTKLDSFRSGMVLWYGKWYGSQLECLDPTGNRPQPSCAAGRAVEVGLGAVALCPTHYHGPGSCYPVRGSDPGGHTQCLTREKIPSQKKKTSLHPIQKMGKGLHSWKRASHQSSSRKSLKPLAAGFAAKSSLAAAAWREDGRGSERACR